MLSVHGKNNSDGSFNWKDAVVDAGIMAGLTFFTSLGGTSAVSVPTVQGVLAAGVAACTEFFLVLAIKRGLREKEEVIRK